jgi:hypothetical protein
MCAEHCTKRADQRKVDDGYLYNCQTNTRTLFAATDCAKQQALTGCPVVPISGSIYFGVSALVVLVCVMIGF